MVQAATSSYSVNKPHIAAWVVYINGIEVPANSVNVDFGVWAIPTAQIRLVPHVLLQRLGHEDRLQVEIYYLDAFFEPDKPRLCLLSEFEVVGWSYQTTAAGRFVQLDCRSPLKIFEQLSFYYMSSLSDVASASAGVVGTTGETYVGTSVKFPLSLFREGLVPTGTDKLITSPFEFVKNVLKALTHPIDLESEKDTDSKDGKVPRAMTGVAGRNFFGRWMQMTDFRRKWAALPFFDDAQAKNADGCFPLLKAINSNEVLNVVAQQIGESVGSQGTAWELFQRVLGAMYMEILAVPAPPAAQFTTETNIPEGYFARRGAAKDKTYGGLVSYMVKPQCIFGIPPACNVIFPSMIKSYSVNENFERQPTRIYLGEAYMSGIVAGQATGDTAQMSRELLVTGYPGVVKQRMQDYINNRQVNTRNFLIYPEELYKGPVSRNTNAPPWLYMLEKLGQKAGAFNTVAGGGSTYTKGSGAVRTLQAAVPAYGPIVKEVAKLFRIPEDFIWGMIGAESRYNKLVVSRTGAGGLVQMMPDAFLSNYELARAAKPSLPAIKDYKPTGTIKLKNGVTRNLYEPGIYADIQDEIKNLYASGAMIRNLANKYGVTNFAVKETDPKSIAPTPAHVMLIGYNAGPGYGNKLRDERNAWIEKTKNKNYVPPPRKVKKDKNGKIKKDLFPPDYVNFFNSSSWDFPDDASKGLTQHWRYYAGRIHSYQIAYLAYMKTQPGGNTQDAPSSPEAPPPDDFNERSDPKDEETAQSNPQAQAAADAATAASPDDKTPYGMIVSNAYAPGQVTTGNASVMNATAAEATLGLLFEKYAKYEYYRSRFETRSATVMLAFNPYVIPGFSAVILDNDISGFHTVGYVNSVSHSFSASGDMQTTVVLSYVRTLPEYLKLAITGTNDLTLNEDQNQDSHVGPSEVILEVSNALQYYESAGLFFSQLFYPGVSKGSSQVFDIDEYLDLTDLEGNVVAAFNDGGDWTPERGLLALPRDNFKDYFRSYDAAMNFASRPVATLQQMIELKHGMPLAEAVKAKLVQGPLNPFSSSASSTFYARIYHLDQPGADVDEVAISKVTNVGSNNSELTEGNWEVITADHGIPDSRRNWDSILINYRNVVRGSKAAASE